MMITFSGTPMSEFNARVYKGNVDSAPQREVQSLQIAGRSGNAIVDSKRYSNVEVSYYLFFVGNNSEENCVAAKNFLLSRIGYARLEDTDFQDEYRIAYVSDGINPVVTNDRTMFKFQVLFSCKPQRYLISGETVTTLTANGTITNPTLFPSQPLLRVYGTGQLGINSETVTISQADVYTDIDCEMMDCFKGTANRNPFVTFSNYNFPVLAPGANSINLGAGITRVEITPRWWRI